MRFGIITDIHFTAGQDAAGLLESVLDWQRCGAGFAIQLGDLIAGESGDAGQELDEAQTVLEAGTCAVRHVIGNHCLAIPEAELLGRLDIRSPYYSFLEGGYRFIVLHGMDISVHSRPETPEDSALLEQAGINPALHDYCGGIGKAQKQWLRKLLDTAGQQGENVIVVCHFPLLPQTSDPKHGLLWNHEEIASIITTSHAVKACFSGHFHPGAYTVSNGIHFISIPAFTKCTEGSGFISGTVEIERSHLVIRNRQNMPWLELTLR